MRRRIAAGKHIYTEKPTAEPTSERPLELAGRGRPAPASSTASCRTSSSCRACCKLKRADRRRLLRPDPVGARRVRLLGLRGRLAGRRSARRWNYRAEDGGGIVARHVPALGVRAGRAVRPGRAGPGAAPPPTSRSAGTSSGKPYDATADDAAYGIFELEGGVVAQINSSWAVRVNRDELVEFQVDGTARQRRRRPARTAASSTARATPQAGLEPGPARHRAASATSGRRCRTTASSTTASRPSGSCSCATSCDDAPFTVGPARRRPRRAARRAGPAVVRRGPPHRGPGDCCGGLMTIVLPAADGDPAALPISRAPRLAAPGGAAAVARRVRGRARGRRPARRRPRRRRRRRRLGRHAARSAATCGRTGSASPRRWTPRSAAWAWTGPRPAS